MKLGLFAISLFSLGTAMAQSTEMTWVKLPDPRIEVDGLPWFGETGGRLMRFPERFKDTLPPAVWTLSLSPSGGRIRFKTNASKLMVRLEYPGAPNMANMHAFGQTGVDLYLDGVYRGTAVADKDSKPGHPVEKAYFDLRNQAAQMHDVVLYLPLYKGVNVLGIGFSKNASVVLPAPFALPKPVVFYGTSITQGGCASRSGMSYQAMLGRMLGIDYVNLGFSGAGKGEPAVAKAVAEIDAAAFVLDFSQNNRTLASVQEVYDPFLAVLRKAHPETPIIAITPIMQAMEQLSPENESEAMRVHIRKVVSARIAAGDTKLQLIEGTDLIGADRLDGYVDGTHPNDLGFKWMADGIAARLAKVLGLRFLAGIG